MWALLRDRKFLHASAVLVGTMIGVGIYGIPFVFAKAGYFVGTGWLVAIAAVMALVHLLIAELTLATNGEHQLVGYVTIWLGRWARCVFGFAFILALTGALLAFIIVFGEFAHNVLSNFVAVDPQLYSILFALVGALVWFARIRTFASIEIVLISLYFAIVILISIVALPHIDVRNFMSTIPDYWFLPYGVLLFAFSGSGAIAIQRQLLRGRERLMRPAIIAAMVFVAFIYLLFATIVVGVSGDITSPEALAGLYGLVPSIVVLLGSVLGMVTISTSYIALGTALYETYRMDYGISARWAWLFTVVPPLAFFWSGLRNFIDVIGLAGAGGSGLIYAILLIAYLRSRRVRLRTPEFHIRIPAWAVVLLIAALAAGSVYEIVLR